VFEFVSIRQTWMQERVFFLLDDGTLTSVPTAWTDAVVQDAFVACSAGRSAFRVEDLLALAEVIDGWAGSPGRNGVQGELRRYCKYYYAVVAGR
jgi:Family of unknown function (DUF5372)